MHTLRQRRLMRGPKFCEILSKFVTCTCNRTAFTTSEMQRAKVWHQAILKEKMNTHTHIKVTTS